MKRREFFLKGASALALPTALAAQQAPSKGSPSSQTSPGSLQLVASPPVAMAPTSGSMEIVWAVNRLARGWVEYGTTPKLGSMVDCTPWGFVPQSDKVLRVFMDGLGTGQTYYYKTVTIATDASQERIESGIRTLRTLNPSAPSVNFAVWNDTHQNNETILKLHEATPDADFLLWNGDTCNNWTSPEIIAPTILNPAGTDFTAKRPLLLIRGNHDIRGPHAYLLSDYAATPGNRPFYAFRHGPVAFICLDTGEDKDDNHPSFGGRVSCETLRMEQAAWIKKQITLPGFADAPYRVVFCHIPLRWKDETTDHGYDHYSRRSRVLWHDSLAAWKTQVVISGHTHQAHWMPPTADFPYAQIVGGGPKLAAATFLNGQADARMLTLTQTFVASGEKKTFEFKPLA